MEFKTPLWMPEGSVRALIAMSLVAAVIFSPGEDTLKDLAMVVVPFYFGTKVKQG